VRTVLETARLALREMDSRDLDFVAAMLGDPEVMRFYPKALSRDEAAAWIERQRRRYAEDGHGLWLVLERASGVPVGQVGLLRQEVEGVAQPEIGYLLHRPCWHRGFATEAALGVRSLAFETRKLERVISLIRPENLPSQAVAERLGMLRGALVDFKGLPHHVWSVCRAERTEGAAAVAAP